MKELKFKNDPAALARLANAQSAIDEYSTAHPGSFSEEEHREFGALLKERAAALSEATGLKIHSIVDDD